MAALVGNLVMIRSDIRAHFSPDPVIYWLGDTSHRRRKSDHNPDGYGRVYAIDVMYNVGSKASAVVKACVGRWDLAYIIHNRTIWSKAYGWRARRYTGSDPHRNHVHISGVHATSARNRRTHLSWGGAKPVTSKPAAPAKPVAVPKYPGLMKRGSKGAGVRTAQAKLKARGWTIAVDGIFGPGMERVVKLFQKDKHLPVSGVLYQQTWNALWRSKVT